MTPATTRDVRGARSSRLSPRTVASSPRPVFDFTAGPVLGGFGAEISLRAPFYAVAALGLVSAIHAVRALEETKPPAPGSDRGASSANGPSRESADASPPRGRLLDVLVGDARFASAAAAHATTFALRQGGRNLLLALIASDVFGYGPLQLGQLFGAMALTDLIGVGPASWLSDKVKDPRYRRPRRMLLSRTIRLRGISRSQPRRRRDSSPRRNTRRRRCPR